MKRKLKNPSYSKPIATDEHRSHQLFAMMTPGQRACGQGRALAKEAQSGTRGARRPVQAFRRAVLWT